MADLELVQRLDLIKSLCSNRKVLHLGCTNFPYTSEAIQAGSHLHISLSTICSELYGFDSDSEGLDTLRDRGCKNLYTSDLENLDQVELDEAFDVIIAGEIIEHLNNPGLFLSGIQRFMSENTLLVLTTVNAYCGFRFLRYGLRGKKGANEPVHPDHVAYYSYSTLRLLVARHRLSVDKFMFYDLGNEHRPHNRRLVNFLNDCFVWFSPHLADGLIAICKKITVNGTHEHRHSNIEPSIVK